MTTGSPPRFKTYVWVCIALSLVFVGMQCIRPALSNPPVGAELNAPPEVKQILKNSCYNCHSNQVHLYWYDQLAPAYWLVAKDVNEGRRHLNFSEIGKLPAAQQKGVLYEAVNQIQLGAMPLPRYTRVHPEAVLTAEQVAILRNYLVSESPAKTATTAEMDAADAAYGAWLKHGGGVAPAVAAAPNGIAFLPDYKNWKTLSSTDRFDNHTLRAILGNDVAVRAIAENHINPWPDGTVFAKIAWFQQQDASGVAHAGAFQQVEFMIRDSHRYASTLGWGFARWRGTDLKPYGKDAKFTSECVGCHTPMRRNDYVFTMPLRGQQ